jgi:hypothetical protein
MQLSPLAMPGATAQVGGIKMLDRRALFGWIAAVPVAVQEVVKNPPWAAQEIGGAQVGTLVQNREELWNRRQTHMDKVVVNSLMVQGQFTGYGGL